MLNKTITISIILFISTFILFDNFSFIRTRHNSENLTKIIYGIYCTDHILTIKIGNGPWSSMNESNTYSEPSTPTIIEQDSLVRIKSMDANVISQYSCGVEVFNGTLNQIFQSPKTDHIYIFMVEDKHGKLKINPVDVGKIE